MKRSNTLFSLVLLLVTVLGFACGGKSKDNNGTATPKTTSSGGSSSSADLRLVGSDPVQLDPALAQDAGSAYYIVEMFSGLVSIDKDLKIIPDLAESWDISSDGKVYTFHIRKSALFHDGRPVTADDVKYSLERAAKLGQTTSVTAAAYLGDIVGVNEVVRGRASTVSGIEVVDQATVKITIDAAKPYFIAKLTYPTAFIVDKQQVESNPRNWTRKPNGTGPYKMVEYRINERIVLQANDKYVLGAPAVKRVSFNLAGGSQLTQYENGDIDVSGISINDIERVQSARDPLNKEYVSGPSLSVGYVGFNTRQAPFDDPKVRLAFARSIDRNQIAHVILKDMEPVANSIMMPGLPGYNKDAQAPSFDPAAAKDLLAQSKYKDPKGLGQITLTEVGGGANVGFDTQAMIEQWKKNLGVDVQIAQSEQANFFDDLDHGKMQMFTSGWIMDYPDPEDILDIMFWSQSKQNSTFYSNPQVDDLVVKARTEQDVAKRLQMYQQAEKIILDEAPWIPLYFGRTHEVVKPYVKGYDPSPIVIPVLRYVTIQK